ncbi:response regulator [Christensenellaceae bacterium OttesenSCG-928-M15]|nr:response regulator [Christensenellaceae bacterium OttesenSCG-928-M15]
MKLSKKSILHKLLKKELDLRIRLFNVLALAGMIISFSMAATGVVTDAGLFNALMNLLAAALSCGLLYYSYTSGRYALCYMITIIVIFLVFFPALFFSSGGYRGGMPSFFIFAVLFTTFMLEGKKVYVMTLLELAVYSSLCIYAYYYPAHINHFETEEALLIDILIGFLTVCVTLGITMTLHFRLYSVQQRELEHAREEAVYHSEVKSTFLANMSHEIRTPINVILGMNEMILREAESGPVAEYGASIQRAGRTLLTLINNILDMSKIESGKLEMIEEDYQMQELIHDLVEIGRERSEKKGLQFIVEVQKTLPGVLTGDFIHIKQIILNFISNAVKYTHEGAVTLHFEGEADAQTPDRYVLHISVVDTGIGIEEKNIPFLFDAFTRADLPSHRDIEGTGLGLSISRQLAQLMGGSIDVVSRWGEGSEFSLKVPQTVYDAEPLGEWRVEDTCAHDASRGGFLAPKGRVLIVDDNEENLQVIKSLLKRTLLRVDTANSGQECLRSVKETAYHLIFMDFMMPDMDGVETFHLLQREIPGFNAPVVALTATAVKGIEDMFLEEGFAGYLSKPVSWRVLEDALKRHLPEDVLLQNDIGAATRVFSEQQVRLLERELYPYGIKLEGGLHYLGGDLLQYKKMAQFFVENYARARQEAEELHNHGEVGLLAHRVHSLKSTARAMGAENLSDTAARVEEGLGGADEGYLRLLWPLLRFEWERVYKGLRSFLVAFEKLQDVAFERGGSRPCDFQGLLAYLSAHRHEEAMLELRLALQETEDEMLRERLLRATEAVREMDFEEAAALLKDCKGLGNPSKEK